MPSANSGAFLPDKTGGDSEAKPTEGGLHLFHYRNISKGGRSMLKFGEASPENCIYIFLVCMVSKRDHKNRMTVKRLTR